MTKSKTCKRCGQLKGISGFHRHPTCKDGRRPTCKSCVMAARDKTITRQNTADWKAANPEKVREHNRQGVKRWKESNPAAYKRIKRESYHRRMLEKKLHRLADENIDVKD